ncbi:MAG: putative Zn-dependent peptidase [Bradymonadia bacterium]|jgi:predicted Zn-dependent peptidase
MKAHYIALAAGLSLAACGGSPEVRTALSAPVLVTNMPPPPGEARAFQLPEIQETTLANGLQVYLVNRDGFPTVSARLTIDGGIEDFSGESYVLGHSVIHLLRTGTSSWNADAISQMIDANGIGFSTSANEEFAQVNASALSPKFSTIVELIGGLVSSPTFPEDRVTAKAAELAGEESLSRSRPEFHLERMVRRALAPADHSYARYSPESEDFSSVNHESATAAWQSRFAPQIARLVIVGDLPEDALAQVNAAFSQWDNGSFEDTIAEPFTATPCNEAHVVVRENSAQTSIAWLTLAPAQDAPGYYDALLANQVLGGGASARLFMNLREDKSYTYGAYSRFQHSRAQSFLRVSSNVRGEVTEGALVEFEYEFNRYAHDPLTSDLEDARAYLSGVFPILLETNSAIAGQITSLLNGEQNLETLSTYRDSVNAVTEQDARTAGASLFAQDNMVLVMVGERDNVVPTAVAHASIVYVYDLDGALVETLDGEQESTCE